MTSISHSLSPESHVSGENFTVSSFEFAGLLPIMLLRGVGLGFIGLAVVLTMTAALIGIHEIQHKGAPDNLPAEIRYNN